MSELITVNQVQEVAISGAEILSQNKERTEKALAVGGNILKAIQEAGGLNPDLDARANKYLVNVRTAKKDMEEARKPITQLFDQIKKHFTSAENDLDITKIGTVPYIIQTHRNDYVRKIEAEKEKKRQELEAKLNREKEEIEVRTLIETQLSAYIRTHIEDRKQKLQDSFNAITLENFQEKSKALKALKPVYHKAHWIDFKPAVSARYITKEQVTEITEAILIEKDFEVVASIIEGEIKTYAKELAVKLPSLESELKRIAAADQEEKKILEDQRKAREEKEAADRKAAAEEAQRKENEELKLKSESEKAEAIMDNLELFDKSGPETRTGYSITILHQAGAVELFTFWFEREGAAATIEEIEKKSIGQMKTFAERIAHKEGDMISSRYLKYESVYKAVNRK